ncbi:hypothetical protein GCM10011344_45600 [Dokdonia pacifica]|uniref:DUF2851 domain-containing protein n=1 Tax=Dokdonia pacifica TaxID=1627892 RepID=A0A239CU80_9FLAO|nr:DUF2851 family protein [Dokdonia pacifica]GGG39644.1 hypothetical protein GCM10011344_45600 [Dokdonia pacifica]SNS23637.1 Protein of unknown function [Dokdonia pacifica]
MREDFLHYLWKYKKFAFAKAKTTSNTSITIIKLGDHNHLAGPDFFNARLAIGDQEWAGNVEIHIKSSDWYAHGHETDAAYNNVILHVVWEHDVDVYRSDNTPIPTLQLKDYVTQDALNNYATLFENQSKKWINCEATLSEVPDPIWNHWHERLYLERLERKTTAIKEILSQSNNDWEGVLFVMLMRSFGTKVNGPSFQSLATHIDFTIIRKCAQEPFRLEALLLGAGGLLSEDSVDSYVLQLQGEYEFVHHKFQLNTEGILPIQFFKLRPDNFPTIRLSQLAMLYYKVPGLFQKLMEVEHLNNFYTILQVEASTYWDTHYSFTTTQKKRVKKLSKAFIDLLLINTIIPIKFAYSQYIGKECTDMILDFMTAIKSEQNNIIKKYNEIRPKTKNALQSQALIQLKSAYCSENKCLQCAVGNWLMGK